ncbi:MAG: MFS transporter [Candidatus Methanomethylicia archaeon]
MRRRRIVVLGIAQALIALSTGMIGPVYALYFERIAGEISLVPFVIGLYWIIVGVLEILFGSIIDKIGKSRSFLIGGLTVSLGILLYPFVTDIYTLICVEVINAIGYSLQVPAFISLLAELTSREKRGKEVGLVDSFWNIGYGISAVASSILISFFGLSFIFVLAGLFNGISSVIVGRKINL